MDELQYSPVYDEKTQQVLEREFSRIQGECYVDHAGATLYSDNQIKKSLDDLMLSLYTNPHSNGVNGNVTEEIVDNIRYTILDHFHTTQDEYSVIFTSGATAALKTVAETFNFKNVDNKSDEKTGTFVYLQDNHTSVLGMRELIAHRGAKVTCLKNENAFEVLQEYDDKNIGMQNEKPNSLFVYSAQCNFSGFKYPLSWIKNVKNGCLNSYTKSETNWFTLLDAACFAGTNDLNLSIYKPDFVCLSFYKLFGYPTGVGALIVRNDSAYVLKKMYYGGGTVDVVLSSKMFHVKRESLHQRFEDGTVSFLTIVSLQHGYKILADIRMNRISAHVFSLAKFLHHSLLTLHHENGAPVVKLYSDSDYEDRSLQGGIVSFNVLRANGEYVGYMEVLNMAALYKIHLRTGCFCNPGACQRFLILSDEEVLKNYDTGYTCGGTKDLIDGKPIGAVRISFGYMSTIRDVETVLLMLKKCFVSGKPVIKLPLWWSDFKTKLNEKYKINDSKSVNGTQNNLKNNIVKMSNRITLLEQVSFSVKNNNNIAQNGQKRPLKLAKIFVYPVKSCGAYEVEREWILTSKGLQFDREWMIVTSAGVCLTQKQETKLCLIIPVIDFKNNELQLSYPGMPSIGVPLYFSANEINSSKICRGKVCGHKVEGADCGAEVSEWLSLALGRPNLKLIRQSDSTKENTTNKPALSFASQSQYLLINVASTDWLADRVPEDSQCDRDTMLYRFRGNFYVEGCAPFEETRWKTVQIGNCYFKVEAVCTRCQMICIDQTTGKKTVEPLRTLAEEFHGKLKFGIYLVKQNEGNDTLSIGNKIYYE
ncbi:hypothetical protein TSAR_003916 [Trichomalopsis sarcophagae]|uniref:Molybdenum cofactor sulfurase n=1 Tax=Trichomalopsis sarcophagae TaxID=543379 RepID=A0A232ELX1_9HYME|nr:hypothetical protein TSAR_003916 [Trichomalopsis sarcophagae]